MLLRIELFGEGESVFPFRTYLCMTMTHPATAVQMGVEMMEMSDCADKVVILDYDCGGWFKETIKKSNKDKYFKYSLSYNAHAAITENGIESIHTYPRIEKFKSMDMLYSRRQDLDSGNIRLNESVSRYSDFVINKL